MISKLCAYNRRSEFILQVLQDELKEAQAQTRHIQVMILAHNKNVLTYLHDAIVHRQMATVGYYVGGMKEADLKKSESCQVIIATYAMAAEALDIKTLSALFLATPKTDVIQAVGRILRVKHEQPLVVDFVDSHEVFLSQWQKRRKYYASNNYTIMYIQSSSYIGQMSKWTNLSIPKKATACSGGGGGGFGKLPTKKPTSNPSSADDAKISVLAKMINSAAEQDSGDDDMY
jgi:hypothetical protein